MKLHIQGKDFNGLMIGQAFTINYQEIYVPGERDLVPGISIVSGSGVMCVKIQRLEAEAGRF